MEFPWDIENLLGGEIRAMYAPISEPLPVDPTDIFAQVSPYDVAGTWEDFGAARDSSTYSRGITATDWTIQQSDAAVVRKPSAVTRRVTVSMAEFTEKTLQIVESAPTTGVIAASAGHGAFQEVGMGEIDSFTRYRVAFVSMRDESAGLVTGAGGESRGRFVIGVGWECSITADDVSLEQAKAGMSALNVTFEFYPSSGQPSGKRFGTWWLEDAGAIA